MSSRDLHPLLSNISERIGNVRTEIQNLIGEVQKIREAIKEGVDAIVDAINDNTQAQAEVKLIDEMSEVHSLEPQITAEETTIEEERDELEATLDRIGERYQEKQEELDQKAEERIRDVGSHIFEIDEDEFEESVETPFVEHVTSTWAEFREHNNTVQSSREGSLRQAIDQAYDSIDGFIDRRERLLADIDHHRTDTSLTIDEPTPIQVPCWEITVERGAESKTFVVGPSRIQHGDGEWLSASIDQLDQFDDPMHAVTGRPPDDTTRLDVRKDNLVDVIDQHGDERLGGLVSYSDAFGDVIEDGVRIEVEE